MKQLFVILFLSCFIPAIAQVPDTIHPTFQGKGQRHFAEWVHKQIRIPSEAKNIEGRLTVRFYIDTTGRVIDVEVIRGLHPSIDQEVTRTVFNSPRWTPGEINGKKVRTRHTLPLTFTAKQQEENSIAIDNSTFAAKDTEKKPTFQRKDEEHFSRWVYRRFRYPTGVRVKGRLICSFVVDSTGKVVNAKVLRGIHPWFDQEAIRVISRSPKWTPGEKDGKKVNVGYILPIIFEDSPD